MLTAMHDGMSTFFIVTTSDLIGQDSKTTKKLRFKVHYVRFFLKVSNNLRPNHTTYNFYICGTSSKKQSCKPLSSAILIG